VARREVRSIGGARGGVGGAVSQPEMPGDSGAPVDTVAASDTLPSATTLSKHRSRPVLGEGVAPAAQLDGALEARWHGSSTAAARSRGACSVWFKLRSDGISSLRGVAWSPTGRRRGTARGGEARDAWVAAPVAGAAVLDITREQQQSGGVRRKSRVGWKRERVAKIGFSSTQRPGYGWRWIRRSTWPARPWHQSHCGGGGQWKVAWQRGSVWRAW
jgi:hypothetical protein